jgi:hypothetical protein
MSDEGLYASIREAAKPERLDMIDAWCEHMLERFKLHFKDGKTVCAYTDELPTHSIRSTVASMSAALREVPALLAEVEQLRGDVEQWKSAALMFTGIKPGLFLICNRALPCDLHPGVGVQRDLGRADGSVPEPTTADEQ